jgi:hypothetical protein
MSIIEPERGTPQERRSWQAGFEEDVDRIAATLGVDGIAVAGRRVAVIDSGDGILALGIAARLEPAVVVGYDDAGCNTVTLGNWAEAFAGRGTDMPQNLRFVPTEPYALPGEPGSVELAVWWGDLGKRRDSVRMLREIARLLAPQAHLLVRVPPSGPIGLDQLQHALLAAGLMPARVDIDTTCVRPDVEGLAETLSGLATRSARVLAYRPG